MDQWGPFCILWIFYISSPWLIILELELYFISCILLGKALFFIVLWEWKYLIGMCILSQKTNLGDLTSSLWHIHQWHVWLLKPRSSLFVVFQEVQDVTSVFCCYSLNVEEPTDTYISLWTKNIRRHTKHSAVVYINIVSHSETSYIYIWCFAVAHWSWCEIIKRLKCRISCCFCQK